MFLFSFCSSTGLIYDMWIGQSIQQNITKMIQVNFVFYFYKRLLCNIPIVVSYDAFRSFVADPVTQKSNSNTFTGVSTCFDCLRQRHTENGIWKNKILYKKTVKQTSGYSNLEIMRKYYYTEDVLVKKKSDQTESARSEYA